MSRPVGDLDVELAEAARRVVERVVDASATSWTYLGVDALDVVDADVRVPDLVDDPPVGNDPCRFPRRARAGSSPRRVRRSRSRVDRRRRRSGSRACPGSRRPIAPGRRRAAQARCRSPSPRPDATAHYPLQRPSRVLDRRAAAAYDSICAWLTLESRSSIEARRLEGLLLRVRVALVAAPERGAARWWCACTAPAGLTFRSRSCSQKEETMNHEQAQANLQLVLDWIDALRRDDIDAIAERFHPDVAWQDAAGGLACEGREQVLAWLRAARDQPTDVDALELLADDDRAVLGVRNHARQELAGVRLDGQLFTVFTLRDGQIVHLRDHAHRAEALSDAGLDHQWR